VRPPVSAPAVVLEVAEEEARPSWQPVVAAAEVLEAAEGEARQPWQPVVAAAAGPPASAQAVVLGWRRGRRDHLGSRW
jgi:hypothetical protein